MEIGLSLVEVTDAYIAGVLLWNIYATLVFLANDLQILVIKTSVNLSQTYFSQHLTQDKKTRLSICK